MFRSQLLFLLHLESSLVTGDIMVKEEGEESVCVCVWVCRWRRDGEGVIDCEINWREWRGGEMEE